MSRNRDPARLSHVDEQGRARMVDVGGKETTRRRAVASGRIRMSPATLAAIRDGAASKGDVLAVARIAAIQAGKEASRWIPLCHPIPLDAIDVDLGLEEQPAGSSAEVRVRVEVRSRGRTGVEMEALTAASAALLTIYDMCKGTDRGMTLGEIRLEEKEGGRSGSWRRGESQARDHPRGER